MYNVWLALCVCLAVAVPQAIAETLRDPTRPLNYQTIKKRAPQLVLQAIYARDNGNTAVINGQMIKAGERIGAFTVVNITDSKVYYQGPGGTRVLALRQNIFENK